MAIGLILNRKGCLRDKWGQGACQLTREDKRGGITGQWMRDNRLLNIKYIESKLSLHPLFTSGFVCSVRTSSIFTTVSLFRGKIDFFNEIETKAGASAHTQR